MHEAPTLQLRTANATCILDVRAHASDCSVSRRCPRASSRRKSGCSSHKRFTRSAQAIGRRFQDCWIHIHSARRGRRAIGALKCDRAAVNAESPALSGCLH